MKWVTHCFLHLIICKSMTCYSIPERSNRWKSKRAIFGLWVGCLRTSQFSSWMMLNMRFTLSRTGTPFLSVLC
jgi:hypothetical protein